MGTISRAIKSDLKDVRDFFLDWINNFFISFIKSLKSFFHIHKWKYESTEEGRITLFKKLYKANGWSTYYRTDYYRCSKCGEIKSEKLS